MRKITKIPTTSVLWTMSPLLISHQLTRDYRYRMRGLCIWPHGQEIPWNQGGDSIILWSWNIQTIFLRNIAILLWANSYIYEETKYLGKTPRQDQDFPERDRKVPFLSVARGTCQFEVNSSFPRICTIPSAFQRFEVPQPWVWDPFMLLVQFCCLWHDVLKIKICQLNHHPSTPTYTLWNWALGHLTPRRSRHWTPCWRTMATHRGSSIISRFVLSVSIALYLWCI